MKNIPEVIEKYLNSMKSTEMNIFICKKYGITGGLIGKYINLVGALYAKDLLLPSLFNRIEEIFEFDKKKAIEMAIDIAGMKLLVIESWLDIDLKRYIEDLGGNPNEYIKYIKEHDDALIEEEKYFKEQLSVDEPFVQSIQDKNAKSIDVKDIDYDKEKIGAVEMFNNSLFYILKSEENIFFEEYNLILIKELIADKVFKKNLEHALLSNQEQIARQSISDWLKDFISQKGSGMFDDLVLTDYVLHSPNCLKLTDADRRLVQKLLLLFRNLKFFPDSMPNDTGEGWEIIPIDDKVREFDRPALRAPKSEEEKHIEALKEEKEAYKPDSLEGKMIEEEINNEKKIEGLKLMAERYAKGSLEWKAIMDEVRKLGN